jgi:flagellar motor protein MotB
MSASRRPLAQPAWFQKSRMGGGERDRWTVSYVDVLTILLVLFVAASARTVAQEAAEAGAPPNIAAVAPLSESLERLRARGLDARLSDAGLVVSLPQAILFQSGNEEISPDASDLIEGVAEVLRDVPNRIRLAGYSDSAPVRGGRFRDNWELAAARGLSLLDLLINQYGIDESRLSVESFGAQAPRDSNDTVEGRAMNRRVEILVLN